MSELNKKRRCTGCLEYKPATPAWFAYKADRHGGRKMRSRCKTCMNERALTLRKTRIKLFSRATDRPYEPGPKPCHECHSMPWRVEGASCFACGLKFAEEPAPELAFRRFDRVG